MLSSNEWVNNEIREKSESTGKQVKMNSQPPKPIGHSENSPDREVPGNTSLAKEDRKTSNKQADLHLRKLEQQQQSPDRAEGRK